MPILDLFVKCAESNLIHSIVMHDGVFGFNSAYHQILNNEWDLELNFDIKDFFWLFLYQIHNF